MNIYTRLVFYSLMLICFAGCSKPYVEGMAMCAFSDKRFRTDSPTTPQLNVVKLTEEEIKKSYPNCAPNVQGVYRLVGKGFSPGKRYGLFEININYDATKIIPMKGILVDNDGRLSIEGHNQFLDEMDIVLSDFMNGEESKYLLVPEEGTEYIGAIITPNAIETKWDDGANVSVVSSISEMYLFDIYGYDFEPGEKLVLTSHFNNGEIQEKINVWPTGNWRSFLCFEFGSGIVKLTIQRENSKENRTLEFAYGFKEAWNQVLKNSKS